MKISISRNSIEKDMMPEIKNLYSSLVKDGYIKASNIDEGRFKYEPKEINTKIFWLRTSKCPNNPDIEELSIDINDNFIIDVIRLWCKFFCKFMPIVSMFKGFIPVLKNMVSDIHNDSAEFIKTWSEEYKYTVVHADETKYFKDVYAIIKRNVNDLSWETVNVVNITCKYPDLAECTSVLMDKTVKELNEIMNGRMCELTTFDKIFSSEREAFDYYLEIKFPDAK